MSHQKARFKPWKISNRAKFGNWLKSSENEYNLAIPVIAVKPYIEQEAARLCELLFTLRPLVYL